MSHWVQTYTGRKLVLESPSPDDICIEDIAHALSLQCRFNGHCIQFYSVADHSIRVAELLPPEHQLAGLLHDAAEAYIGDMVRPLKVTMPEFSAVERRIMQAVKLAFGVARYPVTEIKRADNIMLATEARDLMPNKPDDWHLDEDPLLETVVPLSAEQSERMFLAWFRSLTAEIESHPGGGILPE